VAGPTHFVGKLYCYSASAACHPTPYMFIVDDPLLALILRFVVDTDSSPAANEEFLQHQIRTIKLHLAQSPGHEPGAKAMEWIEQHAEKYRRNRQRRAVSNRTGYLRCEDCPLASLGAAEHCEIHEQWLYLLRQYTAGRVSSRSYIESALDLLRQHKEELKMRSPKLDDGSEPKPKSKSKNKNKKKGKEKKKQKRHASRKES